METSNPKEYIAPEVKMVQVIVEKGFGISAVILDRKDSLMEKHQVDEEIDVW